MHNRHYPLNRPQDDDCPVIPEIVEVLLVSVHEREEHDLLDHEEEHVRARREEEMPEVFEEDCVTAELHLTHRRQHEEPREELEEDGDNLDHAEHDGDKQVCAQRRNVNCVQREVDEAAPDHGERENLHPPQLLHILHLIEI